MPKPAQGSSGKSIAGFNLSPDELEDKHLRRHAHKIGLDLERFDRELTNSIFRPIMKDYYNRRTPQNCTPPPFNVSGQSANCVGTLHNYTCSLLDYIHTLTNCTCMLSNCTVSPPNYTPMLTNCTCMLRTYTPMLPNCTLYVAHCKRMFSNCIAQNPNKTARIPAPWPPKSRHFPGILPKFA